MMGRKTIVTCKGSGQPVRSRIHASKGVCQTCGRRTAMRPDGKARNHQAWVKV